MIDIILLVQICNFGDVSCKIFYIDRSNFLNIDSNFSTLAYGQYNHLS